jgi:sulfur carrier protein
MSSKTIHVLINGVRTAVDTGMTLAGLVEHQGLAGRRIAVEHNGDIIPRSVLPDVVLDDGDRVEIVHAIGGGTCAPSR